MNLDHDFFQVGKFNEDQKKKGLQWKWNTFFPEFRWRPKKRSSPKIEHFFPRIQVKTPKQRSSPNTEHFFSPNSGEDIKKKRSSPNMEHFFSPNSSGDLRSDAHQSQIIGGDADGEHTQFIRGDRVKLFGGTIPPGFGTPACKVLARVLKF